MADATLEITLLGTRRLRMALWMLAILRRLRLASGAWHTRIEQVRPTAFRCVLRRGRLPAGVDGVEIELDPRS